MGRDTPSEEKSPIPPRDRNITFERQADFVVPYVAENINRCRCPDCPVQADSQCVKDKIEKFNETVDDIPAGEVPDPEDFPGVYCSEGRATCPGLDFERQCICGSCEVWEEYDLKDAAPNHHFCRRGRAT